MNTVRDTIQNESSLLRLDRNECICPSFIRSVISSVNIDLLDYCTYKSAFGVISNIATHIQCHSSNLHVNNGSEVVIKTLLEMLKCEEWVTTSPTFEMFNVYCKLYNYNVNTVNYIFKKSCFTIDIPTNNKRKSLYIVSPHNPTGVTFTLNEVLEFCSNYKYVILDEAYINPLSLVNINLLPNNLIIIRTFSKMGGLTGMRFGFCISSNTSLIKTLDQYRPMFLNSLTLKLVSYIVSNSHILTELKQEFDDVKTTINMDTIASAGNFLLLRNTPTYKGYSLKGYIFNNVKFHRLTLFDKETYNTL